VGGRLTPRRIEILRCMARGLSYQAAGWQLGISPNTVRNQMQKIFDALGLEGKRRRKILAIRLAREMGVMD